MSLFRATLIAPVFQIFLAAIGLFMILVATFSVLLNDLFFLKISYSYINPYIFLVAFLVPLFDSIWGLRFCIFLMPLSAGLATQLNAHMGMQFLFLPNAGLDIIAGFIFGFLVANIRKIFRLAYQLQSLCPWPLAVLQMVITFSTAIAISRNIFQSASTTSLKGVIFNLIHFRPIDWRDDFMPISDWVAYMLSIGAVYMVILLLKDRRDKNEIIFRPILAGLFIAALVGVYQAFCGLGLATEMLNFRGAKAGFVAIGFQPDLHAYAGHIVLGVIGIFGYFNICKNQNERNVIIAIYFLSLIALILSKSRSLIIFALLLQFALALTYLWKSRRNLLIPFLIFVAVVLSVITYLILRHPEYTTKLPILSWLSELWIELNSRNLMSWGSFSDIFGARFEIWEAALRMWWEYPLFGIGQGDFYRLSGIPSFSRSHFLILNNGENAHNYFLQTLVETGLIGAIFFCLALLTPLGFIKNRGAFIPATIALLSLFLGNIFSHSFLVRENLLIAAFFVGLLWATALSFRGANLFSPQIINLCKKRNLAYAIAIIMALGLIEVYQSFGRPPFERGLLCYKNHEIWPDQWSSGVLDIPMPIGSHRAEIILKNVKDLELLGTPFLLYYSHRIDLTTSILQSLDPSTLVMSIGLPNGVAVEEKNINMRITFANCFVPRNLGISVDGRRLGSNVAGLKVE